MAEPSAAYDSALERCRQHHAGSKTYSGKLLRPHAPFIKDVIDRHDCRSILDYGCGKGRQYDWVCTDPTGSVPLGMTLEQFWGVKVTRYDPAWPPFAAEPHGTFDLVICTHVLGSIPDQDMAWVVDRLHVLARKALYVAEKIGPVKKHHVLNPTHRSSEQWAALLRRPSSVEVTLSTRMLLNGRAVTDRRVL